MAEEEIALSIREKQVLVGYSLGLSRGENAASCGLTVGQLQHSVAVICAKLGARNSTHAVAIALRRHLID